MATSTETHDAQYVEFDEYISFQLQRTRSSVRLTDLLTAAVGAGAMGVVYLLVFVVLDHWVIAGGFSTAARLTMLGVLLLLMVAWLGWKLVVPYMRRVNPLFAARLIEKSSPELKGGLINLVDLEKSGREVPEEIRRAIEKRAAVTLSNVDVEHAVDRQRLMHLSYALFIAVVLFCLYTVLSPKKPWTSLWRAILPAADLSVATRTEILSVQPGDVEVLARSQLEVKVDLRGEIPAETLLLYATADRKFVDEPVKMRLADETTKQFSALLTGENGRGILQNMTYRIEAGDAFTEEFQITVNQPPSATVDSLHYDFPPYMELSPSTQPGGNLEAWEGTTVTLSGRTNVPVRSAVLRFSDAEDQSEKGEEVLAKVSDGTKISTQWKLALRSDGTSPKFYHVQVRNEDNQTDPDPVRYTVKIRPDLPPDVALLHPAGDIEMPANGVVPLVIEARDPDFKLRRVKLQIEKGGEEIIGPEIYEGSQQGYQGSFDWRLTPLNLKPGDVISFWIEAQDNKQPIANRKNTPKLRIRVTEPVSRDEVEKQLAMDKERQEEATREQDQQEGGEQLAGDKQKPEQGKEAAGQQKPGEELNEQAGRGDEEVRRDQEQAAKDQQKPGDNAREKLGADQKPGERGDQPQDRLNPEDEADDQQALQKILDRQKERQQEQDRQEDQGTESQEQQEGGQDQRGGEGSREQEESADQNGSESGQGKEQQKQGENSQDQSEAGKPGRQNGDSTDPQKQGQSQKKDKSDSGEKGADENQKQGDEDRSGEQKQNGGEKSRDDRQQGKKGDDSEQGKQGEKDPSQKGSSSKQEGSDSSEGTEGRQQDQDDKSDGEGGSQGPSKADKPKDQSGKPSDSGNGESKGESGADKNDGKSGAANKGDKKENNGGEQDKPGDKSTGKEQSADSNNKDGKGGESADKPSDPNNQESAEKKSGETKREKATGDEKGEAKPDGDPNADPTAAKKDLKRKEGEPEGGEGKQGEKSDAEGKGDPAQQKQEGDPATDKKSNDKNAGNKDGVDKNAAEKQAADKNAGDKEAADKNADEKKEGASKSTAGDKKNQQERADEKGESSPGEPDDKADPQKGDPSKQEEASSEEGEASKQKSQGTGKESQQGKGSQQKESQQKQQSGKEAAKPGEQSQEGEPGEQSQEGQPGQKGDPGKQDAGKQGKGSPSDKAEGKQGEASEQGKPGQQGGQEGQDGGKDGNSGKGKGAPSANSPPGQNSDNRGGGSGGRGSDDAAAKNGAGAGDKEGKGKGEQGGGNGSDSFTADEPDLEAAKKATNLVLRNIEGDLQRGEVDEELLKELGWTKEEMQKFVERMQNALGQTDLADTPEAQARQRQFEEMLKSLNLKSRGSRRSGESIKKRGTDEIGPSRTPTPAEYREYYEAFTRSLSKQATAPPKKKQAPAAGTK